MKGAGLKLTVILMAVSLAVGCSSRATKTDNAQSRAQVEDRSAAQGTGGAGDVQSQGLSGDGAMSLAALNDPDSPLAVRTIYFDYDSVNIRADFADTVAAHASLLAANPGVAVTLEGHADERGSREYNLARGSRRTDQDRKLWRGTTGGGRPRRTSLCDESACRARILRPR